MLYMGAIKIGRYLSTCAEGPGPENQLGTESGECFKCAITKLMTIMLMQDEVMKGC